MTEIDYIENRTFEEIRVGDAASLSRTLQNNDIQAFAILSGDISPTHLDPDYAKSFAFREIIAHGMWPGVLITTVLGTELPGPGAIFIDQSIHFVRPVRVGDTVTVTVTCKQKFDHTHHILFDCVCVNQDGAEVIRGVAEVKAPTEKVRRPKVVLPELKLAPTKKSRYEHLLAITQGLSAIPMAVVHPCDQESLGGALMARDEGLIQPLLVGPAAKIRALAEQFHFNLDGCEMIDVPHSHAAAETAVALVREGRAEALMKGSLHTDELMGAVVRREGGLRTSRRISHCFVMDVPGHGQAAGVQAQGMALVDQPLQGRPGVVQADGVLVLGGQAVVDGDDNCLQRITQAATDSVMTFRRSDHPAASVKEDDRREQVFAILIDER